MLYVYSKLCDITLELPIESIPILQLKLLGTIFCYGSAQPIGSFSPWVVGGRQPQTAPCTSLNDLRARASPKYTNDYYGIIYE